MRARISATVITLDEERNLGACLASLVWVDEIVVVDGGSTDRTREIARQYGARVFEHPFDDFASQRNRAIDAATGDWILSIDADERVPDTLAAEIRAAVDNAAPGLAGFWVPMRTRLFGRWFRYSGTQHERKMRLFRRGCTRWRGTVHEIVELDGDSGAIAHPMLHESTPDLETALRKLNRYSTLDAARIRLSRRNFWRPWLVPPWRFARLYFGKLGILDGIEGFQFCVLAGFEVWIAFQKARERRRSP